MTTSEKFELTKWAFDRAQERAYHDETDLMGALIEGFQKAKELYEPRWIAVSDDYPEFGVLVLVSFCGIVSYGRWDGFLWTVNDEPEHSLMKIDRIRFVTHWMLLPKAPQPTEAK